MIAAINGSVCVGAPAAFVAAPCLGPAGNPGIANTSNLYSTTNFATVELLSSVVDLAPPPQQPVVIGTPEPATLGLLSAGIGFVILRSKSLATQP